MPTLSTFYGILVRMNMEKGGRHHLPHIHAKYAGYEAVYDFEGNLIEGNLPKRQASYVVTWILLREEDLKTNWHLIQEGQEFYRIEPLH